MNHVRYANRAMICDDRDSNFELLRKYLSSRHFQVDPKPARNGPEVEARLRRSHKERQFYSCVAVDMQLGIEEDGGKIVLDLAQRYPKEYFILYSTADDDNVRAAYGRIRLPNVAVTLLARVLNSDAIPMYLERALPLGDPSKVFLVHGRHDKKVKWITDYLKLLSVDVLPFAAAKTLAPRKYVFDIVLKGIEETAATVVLFTDEVEISLRPQFRSEPGDERIRGASRPNVYIEAGYAAGLRPGRTVFVEWPDDEARFERPSDFAGIHAIRVKHQKTLRSDLRRELEESRVNVVLKKNWFSARL